MAQWLLGLFASSALLFACMWIVGVRSGLSTAIWGIPLIWPSSLLALISFTYQRMCFRRALLRFQVERLGRSAQDYNWMGCFLHPLWFLRRRGPIGQLRPHKTAALTFVLLSLAFPVFLWVRGWFLELPTSPKNAVAKIVANVRTAPQLLVQLKRKEREGSIGKPVVLLVESARPPTSRRSVQVESSAVLWDIPPSMRGGLKLRAFEDGEAISDWSTTPPCPKHAGIIEVEIEIRQ